MKSAILLVVCFAAAGCTKPSPAAEHRKILDAIAIKCHLPATSFKLEGVDDLHFQPAPDAKFENVTCALTELKKSPFPMKLGFVGNEVYEPEKK